MPLRCIVSDLDGTLLLPDKTMPEEIFPLIEKMYDTGILFVPASGRQLPNLKALFAPVLDKIAIIAENGGLACVNGRTIYSNPTPAQDVLYALGIIMREEGLYPLCSGENCAYYTADDNEQFVSAVKRSYTCSQKTDDIEGAVKSSTILKISVWDRLPAAEHAAKVLIPAIKGLRVKVSDRNWLDVCKADANKGAALAAILQATGIERADCVAFGDHMNDLEMLETSGRAYVPANAYPELIKLIGNVIPSNAERGVLRKIEELI